MNTGCLNLILGDKQNASIMFFIHRKAFLLMTFFLFVVNDANCFLSKNTVNYRYDSSSEGNVTHADDIGPYNSTVKGMKTMKDVGSQRQGKTFFKTDSRTLFAARRRIQFALLPIMYKLGVISTILVGLTVMVLKGLAIGVILLFFALGNSFFKLKQHPTPQPVHFHLHPDNFHSQYPSHHSYGPSGPWDKEGIEESFNYENYDPSPTKKASFSKYPYRYYYPYKGR